MKGEFADFALFRLDSGVPWNAQMCHFGGPIGLIDRRVRDRDVLVHHYGSGTGADGIPARTGDMFFGLYRPDYVFFYGVASTGDSGGPVIDDTGGDRGPHRPDDTVHRQRRRQPAVRHLAAASKALKIKLTLLTAPTL